MQLTEKLCLDLVELQTKLIEICKNIKQGSIPWVVNGFQIQHRTDGEYEFWMNKKYIGGISYDRPRVFGIYLGERTVEVSKPAQNAYTVGTPGIYSSELHVRPTFESVSFDNFEESVFQQSIAYCGKAEDFDLFVLGIFMFNALPENISVHFAVRNNLQLVNQIMEKLSDY